MKIKCLFISLFFIALISCEKEKTNPYDPDSDIDFSPKNLVAESISPYVIELRWEMTETSIDGFKVDRKIGSGNWENSIAEDLGNNATSWIDYCCSPSTDYTYRIYAIAGDNMSDYKTIESKTPEGNQTGTFTDLRDGNEYKWVKIGDQIWMAENLAYIPFVFPCNESGGIWVPGNNNTNIQEATETDYYKAYGCLYSREIAEDVIPDGWHLPSYEEWDILFNYLGGIDSAGMHLRETTDKYWSECGGTNKTGFTALPGGSVNITYDSPINYLGKSSIFWVNDANFTLDISYLYYIFSNGEIDFNFSDTKNKGLSIRCIKN